MIPLQKLEKLPRSLRLRKTAKIFAEAENRLCLTEKSSSVTRINLSASELEFFANAAKSLAGDALFSAKKQKALTSAAKIFELTAGLESAENTAAMLIRALNTVKHLLLAETGRSQADWDFTGSDGRLDPSRRRVFAGMMVYLEDIRSPFNVGAMFRTAESFGAEKIFLSPFCADPLHKRANRTAMGCVEVLPWERRELFTADELTVPVFALETGGIPLAEFPFPRQGLLIAGSEELGLSPQALAVADASLGRVSIPCYGAKGSLNVSVAFGIVMQKWGQSVAPAGV
ncbi:MAG: TrmH family RNA methyltransferase [Treponema sp.]|jgi:TrmH family RNA methyltransferase|nr:TrmH family RNA methyltransferase [Treponema sp.]